MPTPTSDEIAGQLISDARTGLQTATNVAQQLIWAALIIGALYLWSARRKRR